MKIEKFKKHGVMFLKIGVAVLVIWYLFKSGQLTKESFTRLLEVQHLPFIIISGFAFWASLMLAAVRLVFLLKTIDLHLGFVQSFRLTMIGSFFNIVLPGAVGGDVVKGFYLFKNEKHSKGSSSGIIIIDRLLGLLAAMIIGCASIIYLVSQHNEHIFAYRHELTVIVYIIVGFLCVLLGMFFVLGRNQRVRSTLKEWFTLIFRRSMFYYMAKGIGILAKNLRVLLYAFLLSLCIQLISLIAILVLGNIISESQPNYIILLAVSSLVILFGVIPVTPGNIGWTELLAAYGWSMVGSSSGAAIFMYWRIIIVFCSLPGGIFYLFMRPGPQKPSTYPRSSVIQDVVIVQDEEGILS
jgi:uncharacterized protein (TIRG00374 family)